MKYLVILLNGFEISDSMITRFLVRNGLAPIALSLILQGAGRNIQDREIAWFYYKLMKDAGCTVGLN